MSSADVATLLHKGRESSSYIAWALGGTHRATSGITMGQAIMATASRDFATDRKSSAANEYLQTSNTQTEHFSCQISVVLNFSLPAKNIRQKTLCPQPQDFRSWPAYE
jgi:hypothetical protein